MARRSSDPTVEALWTYFPIMPTSSVSTTQQDFLNLDATQLHDFHRPLKSGKPKSLNLPNETVKSVVLDLVTSFASASRQRNRCPSQGFKNQKAGAYWSSTLKIASLNPGPPPRIDWTPSTVDFLQPRHKFREPAPLIQATTPYRLEKLGIIHCAILFCCKGLRISHAAQPESWHVFQTDVILVFCWNLMLIMDENLDTLVTLS